MSKFEWRKQWKELYLPKKQPVKIEVPEMKFFTIEGSGNPNGKGFKDNLEILYALSYAIRMMPKKGITPEGYFEYTVFPLEGHWDLDEEGRKLDYLNKDHLVYKLMIRQPDFVTEQLFQYAVNTVKQKKTNIQLDNVQFEFITEGLCVQAMHVGSYDDEPKTFEFMEQFCLQNNLKRAEKTHKEIYISDMRKTSPEKLKTVLRYKVIEI
ncbi:GyrI-like domain-containing protein [Niallia circulans]|uniref:GyrI-like domain-containing protein n=1 Tax=Niallia circulans TaxID=1397 RepID=A0A941GNW3_NIACI|nr:GyrI-like domain-containing protein [Niallia circulans]MCB5236896.1 GyrI-like domain-containing protein [Niallia circulans]